MDSPESIGSIDFLTRLTRATSALELRIREAIPEAPFIRDPTNRKQTVGPSDTKYSVLLSRFVEEVSDEKARVILCFLFQFDQYLKHNLEVFVRQYESYFNDDGIRRRKWQSILYEYPKIDQTTICIILGHLSETTIAYRIDDLAQVHLVESSNLPPPKSKHVWITPKGIEVVKRAIADGIDCLAPFFFGSHFELIEKSASQ